jgi:prepilin-type N-terminal cleavage/methylation domain-containing protein
MNKVKNHGFTIVELLIVVVVLGILTAITLTAYNGIQARARDQAYLTAADAWEKLIRQEYILTGRVPGADGVSVYCLGNSVNNFPTTAQFAQGECENLPGSTAYYNQAFIDQFQEKRSFPNGSLPPFLFDDGAGATAKSRGIVAFIGTDGSTYEVHLYWKNNKKGSCARGVDALQATSYQVAACERVFTLN